MKKILTNLVIYISRRNKTLDDIKKYQKKFILIFLPIFLLTAFSYDTSIEGAIFGVQISANIIFLIIDFLIIGAVTLLFYLYSENFEGIRQKYIDNLLMNHEQIICAYYDKSFGDTVYKIESEFDTYYRTNRKHVHTISGNIYYFNDWRVFKFVGVRESRKLKLEQLKSVMNEN